MQLTRLQQDGPNEHTPIYMCFKNEIQEWEEKYVASISTIELMESNAL